MTEADRIENALDELVTAIIEHDAKWAKSAQVHTPAIAERPVAKLMVRTADNVDPASLVGDPVGEALRQTVRDLGGELFRLLGSTKAMRAVLERVAGRDQRRYRQRLNVMDKTWNGIGSDHDLWTSSTRATAGKRGTDNGRGRHERRETGL